MKSTDEEWKDLERKNAAPLICLTIILFAILIGGIIGAMTTIH